MRRSLVLPAAAFGGVLAAGAPLVPEEPHPSPTEGLTPEALGPPSPTEDPPDAPLRHASAPVRLSAIPESLAPRAPNAPAEGNGRVLAGRLVDIEGRPVPDATIRVWPDPPTDEDGFFGLRTVRGDSDRTGAFRVAGVAEGALGITVGGWPSSEDTHYRKLGMVAGEVEVVLGSPTEIAGRVADADNGEPVTSFDIVGYSGFQMCGNAPPTLQAEFSDVAGSFRLAGLDRTTNRLTFRAPGYAHEPLETAGIRASHARDVVVRMRRAVTVRGWVLDRVTWEPMPGQRVFLAFPGEGRGLERLGVTRGDGSFEVSGIRPGPFRLCAGNHRGLESESGPLEGRPGDVIEGFRILHGHGGRIEGIAPSEAAPDLRAAAVLLLRLGEGKYLTNVLPDAAGVFRIEGVSPGEYVVEVALGPPGPGSCPPEWFFVRARASVREGETTTVVFRDPPAPR